MGVSERMCMTQKFARSCLAGIAVALSLLTWPPYAGADILVRIDRSSQRMSVIVNGEHRYTWPVSTGIYGTPSGSFRPQSLKRYHRSTIYNNASMPYSIFYDGNFAIHGTTHVSQLGGPGLARLHQAASVQCRYSLFSGAEGRPGQYQDFDPLAPSLAAPSVPALFSVERLSAAPNRRRARARRW
jgi:hypothetical protein